MDAEPQLGFPEPWEPRPTSPRWANVSDAALAYLRGDRPASEPLPPAPADDGLAQVADGDLDDGSVRHVCEMNRRGLTDFKQSRADFQRQAAWYRASRTAELRRGKARPGREIAPVRPGASPAQRPRERGHRRRAHQTRAGPDDDSGGSEPPPEDAGRLLWEAWDRLTADREPEVSA